MMPNDSNPYGLLNTILLSVVDGVVRWYRRNQYKNNRGNYERKSD